MQITSPLKKISKQIKKFLKIPFAEKKLFLEAVFYLFTAKILLIIFPFKFCVQFITCKNCNKRNIDPEYLELIKTALYRANKLAFWKNICLVQSVAARWMLQRRKIASQFSLGVAHDENKKVIAHAWVKVDDFEITHKGLDYNELINFK